MAGVEGILSIIKFCFFFGIAAVCIVLIATAVLRWINKEKQVRERNLNILAGVALFVLFIMFLIYSEGKELPEGKSINGEAGSTENISPENQSGVEGDNQQAKANVESDKQEADSLAGTATPSTITSSSNTLFFRVSVRAVKSLLFAITVLSAMILLFMVIWRIKSDISDALGINSNIVNGSEKQEIEQVKSAQEGQNKEEKSDGENVDEKNAGVNSIFEETVGRPGEDNKKVKGDVLINCISKPAPTFTIACGLISLFFLIPFLVSGQTSENPIMSWINGASVISDLIHLPSENNNSEKVLDTAIAAVNKVISSYGIIGNEFNSNVETFNGAITAFISYMLIYIILIGGIFTVVQIVCAVFARNPSRKRKKRDECFSCIAFLAVGVSILWIVQKGKIPAGTEYKSIVELLKTYGTVIFVVAITIITMEIIRLLMTIGEKTIQVQAKCLFIFLIGECTILLLDVLIFLYDVVSSAINGAVNDRLAQVKKKLKKKIIGSMETAINKSGKRMDDKEQDKKESYLPQGTAISPFHEVVTKKKNVR